MTTSAADAGPEEGLGPDGGDDARAEDEVRAEQRARLRRGRLVAGGIAAGLTLVVGLVALLGGFGRRTDLITPVPAGSLITTGPYEVTVERATVQHTTSSDEWQVVASGRARTTGATSIGPRTGDNGFVYAKDLRSGESQPLYAVSVGESTSSYEHVENLTPGLPPVPWTLTFRFRADPGDSVLVAVFEQEYTTPYLFSDELGWRATSAASTMTLPLERLPDQQF